MKVIGNNINTILTNITNSILKTIQNLVVFAIVGSCNAFLGMCVGIYYVAPFYIMGYFVSMCMHYMLGIEYNSLLPLITMISKAAIALPAAVQIVSAFSDFVSKEFCILKEIFNDIRQWAGSYFGRQKPMSQSITDDCLPQAISPKIAPPLQYNMQRTAVPTIYFPRSETEKLSAPLPERNTQRTAGPTTYFPQRETKEPSAPPPSYEELSECEVSDCGASDNIATPTEVPGNSALFKASSNNGTELGTNRCPPIVTSGVTREVNCNPVPHLG